MKKLKYNLRKIAEVLYLTLGFNIVGYEKQSKKPIGKWERFQVERQTEDEAFKCKWGILTGVGIVLGPVGNIHAFDIDKAAGDEEPLKLLDLLGLPKDYPWLVRSGSGSGFHIYFKSQDLLPAFNDQKIIVVKDSMINCSQVELRINGLIVAPGSQHESGNYYEFVNHHEFDKPIAHLSPEQVKDVISKLGYELNEPNAQSSLEQKPKPVDATLRESIMDCIEQLKEKNVNLSHGYDEWHKSGLAFGNDLGEAGRDLFHAFSRLSLKYNPTECDKAYTSFLKAQEKKKTSKRTTRSFFYLCRQHGIRPRVHQRVELTPTEPNAFYATVRIIFSRHKVTRDRFTDTVFIDGRPFEERDLNNILVFAQAKYGLKQINKDFIQSVLESDYVEETHRIIDLVKDYVPTVTKGNIQKLRQSLVTKTGENLIVDWRGERRPFIDVVLEVYLVKMMEQFFEPKANDLCLVLLGDMHLGKTYWLTHLLPDELSDLCRITQFTNDKDFKVQLAESALLVIDEIREKDMSSNEFMKMTMSTPAFPLRVPYARKPKLRKRIASLAGTGNNMFILRDPRGNRRFVPLWLEDINKETYNSIKKMDLFYEVYQLYKAGYDTTLNDDLLHAISQISKDFEVRTEADELLLMHCPPFDPKHPDATLLSVREMCDLLFERTKRTFNFTQVGMAVDRLGYEGKTSVTVTYNGKISKVWKYYCDVTPAMRGAEPTPLDEAIRSLLPASTVLSQQDTDALTGLD